MSKTTCIYHSVDLDGWMSAGIVKHWFMTNCNAKSGQTKFLSGKDIIIAQADVITFIGFDYGDLIPDLSEYETIIMCDISFPKEVMYDLSRSANANKRFIWIDHHESAILNSTLNNYNTTLGIRDTYSAACELTWKYFFPTDPIPEVVRLLGRYDCFGHIGTDEEEYITAFQYGARGHISNYNQAYSVLLQSIGHASKNINPSIETVIYGKGVPIYTYLIKQAEHTYSKRFDLLINGFKFAAVNQDRFNPANFHINYHADGYDGFATFHYDPKGFIKFSIYNANGLVDCSKIATALGGGGHKGAAGFILESHCGEALNRNIASLLRIKGTS